MVEYILGRVQVQEQWHVSKPRHWRILSLTLRTNKTPLQANAKHFCAFSLGHCRNLHEEFLRVTACSANVFCFVFFFKRVGWVTPETGLPNTTSYKKFLQFSQSFSTGMTWYDSFNLIGDHESGLQG